MDLWRPPVVYQPELLPNQDDELATLRKIATRLRQGQDVPADLLDDIQQAYEQLRDRVATAFNGEGPMITEDISDFVYPDGGRQATITVDNNSFSMVNQGPLGGYNERVVFNDNLLVEGWFDEEVIGLLLLLFRDEDIVQQLLDGNEDRQPPGSFFARFFRVYPVFIDVIALRPLRGTGIRLYYSQRGENPVRVLDRYQLRRHANTISMSPVQEDVDIIDEILMRGR